MPGAPKAARVVAYDKTTGEPRWHALSDTASYTIADGGDARRAAQLLVVTATRAVGLDSADGTLLWEHQWATDMGINAAQPIVIDDHRFMLSAGYGHGAMLVEVERDGDGLASAQGVGDQPPQEQAELVGLPRRSSLRSRRRHPRVPRRRDRRAALERREVRPRPATARAGPVDRADRARRAGAGRGQRPRRSSSARASPRSTAAPGTTRRSPPASSWSATAARWRPIGSPP